MANHRLSKTNLRLLIADVPNAPCSRLFLVVVRRSTADKERSLIDKIRVAVNAYLLYEITTEVCYGDTEKTDQLSKRKKSPLKLSYSDYERRGQTAYPRLCAQASLREKRIASM
jgi:hypothetical protein